MESALDVIKEKFHDVEDKIEEVQNVGDTERLISVIVGAILSFYGIKRQSTLLGKGLTFAGGLLITRGTTGICPVNRAFGRNTLLA